MWVFFAGMTHCSSETANMLSLVPFYMLSCFFRAGTCRQRTLLRETQAQGHIRHYSLPIPSALPAAGRPHRDLHSCISLRARTLGRPWRMLPLPM